MCYIIRFLCGLHGDLNSRKENMPDGTTWIAPDDGDGVRTLIFKNSTFEFELVYKGKTEQKYTGTYSYNPPRVVMKSENTSLSATIDGDNLTTDKTANGDYIIYNKK
jgi:hypothetical protein